MAINTLIQWADDTANPTMGCDGCELLTDDNYVCYAALDHKRKNGKHPGYSPTFEQITFHPHRMPETARRLDLTGRVRLLKPWLNRSPRLIFVSDEGDSLSKDVPFEYLESNVIWNVTSPQGLQHMWLWLTKQPHRMAEFSAWLKDLGIPWPRNLWAGTSVTRQPTVARVRQLLHVGDENTIRFVSVEPQYESIDLDELLMQVDWIIQGGASGTDPLPFDLAWARDLRGQCHAAGVPYFLKQLGAKAVDGHRTVELRDPHGGDWDEWPDVDLRVRQVPTVPPASGAYRADIRRKVQSLGDEVRATSL